MATKHTKHDVARFDEWSSTYEESWLQRKFFSRVHAAVLDMAGRDGTPESVLDVGCGTGKLLRAAKLRSPDGGSESQRRNTLASHPLRRP